MSQNREKDILLYGARGTGKSTFASRLEGYPDIDSKGEYRMRTPNSPQSEWVSDRDHRIVILDQFSPDSVKVIEKKKGENRATIAFYTMKEWKILKKKEAKREARKKRRQR